jgi:hypothetical protein
MAEGNATCFGEAIADFGDIAAARWADSWFADRWRDFTAERKRRIGAFYPIFRIIVKSFFLRR